MFGDPGRSRRKTPACNAAISVRNPQAAQTDVDHLKSAFANVEAQEAFMTRRRPAWCRCSSATSTIRPRKRTCSQSRKRCGRSTRRSPEGTVLQIDCPDSAWDGISSMPTGLASGARRHSFVEALDHAVANIPPSSCAVPVLGNYEGRITATLPLADVIDIVFRARPSASPSRLPTRATHTNGSSSGAQAARQQGAHSRRDRIEVELHRAS